MKKKDKKIIRKILIGAVVCILLVFSGIYLAFKVVTSPKRLKNSFRQLMENTLNRNVSIEDAKLKFGKLVLKNIRIDFREDNEKKLQHYVVCKKVKVKFRILPLLKKKFVFKEIQVKSPEINLIHGLNINLAELFKQKVNVLSIGKGIFFEIDTLELIDGRINFLLPEIYINNLQLNIKNSVNGLLEIKLKCGIDQSNFKEINLAGTIDIPKNTAEIQMLEISGYGGKAILNGKIKNVLTAPELNFTYNFKEFPMEIISEKIEISGEPLLKGNIEKQLKNLYLSWHLDLSPCGIKYRDLYQKPVGENLRFRGGILRKSVSYDINWYIVELLGASISGTGTISNTKDIDVNIVGESIDLKELSKRFKSIKKYIADGNLNFRGKLKTINELTEFTGKSTISGLKLKNIKELLKLYHKISGIKKDSLKLEEVNIDISIDNTKVKINALNAKGGDIEGWGKGYYKWGNEMNFAVYPRIYGKEIGFRIYGSSDNIKVGLK